MIVPVPFRGFESPIILLRFLLIPVFHTQHKHVIVRRQLHADFPLALIAPDSSLKSVIQQIPERRKEFILRSGKMRKANRRRKSDVLPFRPHFCLIQKEIDAAKTRPYRPLASLLPDTDFADRLRHQRVR